MKAFRNSFISSHYLTQAKAKYSIYSQHAFLSLFEDVAHVSSSQELAWSKPFWDAAACLGMCLQMKCENDHQGYSFQRSPEHEVH